MPKKLLPSEILDAQGDLLERLKGDEDFRMYHAITFRSAIQMNGDNADPEGFAAAWVNAITRWTELSYAYRVTEDMGTLLEHAQASLDETDDFDPTLAPTEWGIVHFERPIGVLDVRGKQMLIHWALWGPADVRGRRGLGFAFFNDHYIQPDEVWMDFHEAAAQAEGLDEEKSKMVYERSRQICGRWNSVSQGAFREGDPLGPSTVPAETSQYAALIAQGVVPGEATNIYRYMHALFLLLNQTVVRMDEERADRPARRRAQKRGLPSDSVTVIQLRRSEATRGESESMIEWSHRWVVRGHWRWQACGPNRSERKRIWIAPFIKGPDDKPFVVKDKLYSLER